MTEFHSSECGMTLPCLGTPHFVYLFTIDHIHLCIYIDTIYHSIFIIYLIKSGFFCLFGYLVHYCKHLVQITCSSHYEIEKCSFCKTNILFVFVLLWGYPVTKGLAWSISLPLSTCTPLAVETLGHCSFEFLSLEAFLSCDLVTLPPPHSADFQTSLSFLNTRM